MKRIVWYSRCFMVASMFCAVAFAGAILLQPTDWKAYAIVALTTGGMFGFLFFAVKKKLTAARLIVENQILNIQPAVLRERNSTKERKPESCESVEVFVSCFGILLGSKVIKFNREGIRLMAVEIEQSDLSLDYGRGMDIHNIRLIHLFCTHCGKQIREGAQARLF